MHTRLECESTIQNRTLTGFCCGSPWSSPNDGRFKARLEMRYASKRGSASLKSKHQFSRWLAFESCKWRVHNKSLTSNQSTISANWKSIKFFFGLTEENHFLSLTKIAFWCWVFEFFGKKNRRKNVKFEQYPRKKAFLI